MKYDAVFSLQYLPCMSWFKCFMDSESPVIDIHEHYLKQSYRNRCHILSANGVLPLSIPVKKLNTKTAVKEMRIENEFNWQRQHWESIISAYNSSPYFFYYRDYFEPLYHNRFDTLAEWNTQLLQLVLTLLKTDKKYVISDGYIPADTIQPDWRERIHPKKQSPVDLSTYVQVFANKFGFTANCSIIDALFNNGPQTQLYLAYK
jgi:hypothetical protein